MDDSQAQPPPDRQNRLNQFAVLMVLLAVAALGADKETLTNGRERKTRWRHAYRRSIDTDRLNRPSTP